MNQKACLLACGLSLTAMLFTGCANDTNDNNNVTTKNTGRGRMITHNVDNNNNYNGGNYTTRSTGYRSYGVTTRDNMDNGRTLGEATRDLGRGIANTTRNVGDDIGEAARDLTGMDNRNNTRYGARNGYGNDMNNAGDNMRQAGRDLGDAARNVGRGTVNATRDIGNNLGQAARDLTGIGENGRNTTRSYGMNGTGTGTGLGTLGTDMGNRAGANRGTTGTTMNGATNQDALVLGNLVIYAGKGNKGTGTGTTGGTAAGNGNLTGGNGGQVTMTVTDQKSIDAIHRVNKSLSGNNAKAKASTIASDIRYILKHAKPATR
ncbi:hypothetical protein [Paenibacillus phyllosphaerae]|nr:hypothetical protein [Paenibacillus phyllosphaerae]